MKTINDHFRQKHIYKIPIYTSSYINSTSIDATTEHLAGAAGASTRAARIRQIDLGSSVGKLGLEAPRYPHDLPIKSH